MATATYEPPQITRVGSLHDLTLSFKKFGHADGVILTDDNDNVIGPVGGKKDPVAPIGRISGL